VGDRHHRLTRRGDLACPSLEAIHRHARRLAARRMEIEAEPFGLGEALAAFGPQLGDALALPAAEAHFAQPRIDGDRHRGLHQLGGAARAPQGAAHPPPAVGRRGQTPRGGHRLARRAERYVGRALQAAFAVPGGRRVPHHRKGHAAHRSRASEVARACAAAASS
jgi:hypothetical protein